MVVEKSRRCLKMLPSCSGASIECGKLILLRNFRRSLCFCTELRAQFNPQLFVDPITELDQIKKPLPEDHPCNYHHPKPMKPDETPVFYRSSATAKLIRCFQMDGRKELVRANVLEALEKIKRRQYKEWINAKTEEKRKEIIVDPIMVAEKGLRNCRPLLKILPVVRGGVTYKVPFPVVEVEAEFRAIKMMKLVCREKARHGAYLLHEILAQELLAASKNEGFTIQAKQEHHKLCEANRAFSHYRK